jgi:hypothetical protein
MKRAGNALALVWGGRCRGSTRRMRCQRHQYQSRPVCAGYSIGAAAPESNPAGDIPDSQVFVPFMPASRLFTVSVPEVGADC